MAPGHMEYGRIKAVTITKGYDMIELIDTYIADFKKQKDNSEQFSMKLLGAVEALTLLRSDVQARLEKKDEQGAGETVAVPAPRARRRATKS